MASVCGVDSTGTRIEQVDSLMQSAAVKADERDRVGSRLVGVADGMHQIARESRSAVNGNQNQNIAALQ